ncbi:L-2-hydroxyglutarate oxidase [Polaribacter litorisediminis]|uniref:L-2-hydroxyglutarate oxidase n=1 Tax=Polaribacter litorisediminis TaxID=1908341 RepID=UPI001CBFBCBD|nr:L-2-hydroxyglutarate oxidase [Polaribacter litorisediminis]UAM96598.1 L-2-hydroxyglutarate oxidase [Polaribacter litorisediminis]
MKNNKKIAIIGGGILGLATGYQLVNKRSGFKVHLFEKEKGFGKHQSGNNSGVLHCGLHYQPGSLKAKLAVNGIREMIRFCEINQINHEICGKVVVASNASEAKYLDNLAERGNRNGLLGVKYLNKEELKVREPNVFATKALLVPEEGIIDYHQVMSTMAKGICDAGSEISYNTEVNHIITAGNQSIINTDNNSYEFDYIINCTGLQSDRTYEKFTKLKSPLKIVPFRGEYMNIKEEYTSLINHLVYPVPDPTYPFLGVHFTRLTNGKREVGPNAVLALKREGYSNRDFNLNDTADTIFYKGFQKFIFKNFRFTMGEFKSSLSKKDFVNKAKKLIPSVEDYMFEKGTAGVRAQAMDKEGELIMDFKIEKNGNQIHVINAPSPGATASLSIASYIIDNYIF